MNYHWLSIILVFSSTTWADQLPLESSGTKAWTEEMSVDGKKVRVLKTSKSISTVVEQSIVGRKSKLCEVEVSTDYWQANDKVRVEVYVDTPECSVAHGAYTVSVRTRDETDEH